jgi:hypothetical protein
LGVINEMKEYLSNQIEEKTNMRYSRITKSEEQDHEELIYNIVREQNERKALKREKMQLYKEELDEQVKAKAYKYETEGKISKKII